MLVRFTCVLLLLSLASPAVQTHAQVDEAQRKALARSLFDEGLEFAKHDQWPQAADRFRRALELKDSAVLSYNLAVALGKLGKVVEASELLLRIAGDAQTRPDIKADAQSELDLVRPRIGKLEIAVRGELRAREVSLDGRMLDLAALGVAMPIDPGEHVVELKDSDRVVQRVEVSVPEAGEERVELELPSTAVPTAAETARTAQPSQPEVTAPRPDDHDDTLWESPWLWAGVGGAAVATVVVVLLSGGESTTDPAEPVRGNLGSGAIVIGGGP